MDQIAFTIDVFEGLGEVEGAMRATADHLILKYRTKDAVFGMIKTGMKELPIPFEHIWRIQYQNSIIGGKITLETQRTDLFENIPGSKPTRLVVKLKRKDRAEGETFVERLKTRLSEYKLNHPDAELSDEDIESLLDD